MEPKDGEEEKKLLLRCEKEQKARNRNTEKVTVDKKSHFDLSVFSSRKFLLPFSLNCGSDDAEGH